MTLYVFLKALLLSNVNEVVRVEWDCIHPIFGAGRAHREGTVKELMETIPSKALRKKVAIVSTRACYKHNGRAKIYDGTSIIVISVDFTEGEK